MSYTQYDKSKAETKSIDDGQKIMSMVKTTIGCFALLLASSPIGTSFQNAECFSSRMNGTNLPIVARADKRKGDSGLDSESKTTSVDVMASAIKEMLGINISDLAKILGVSRPTVYKYLDGEGPTDSFLVSHITDVYNISELWNKHTSNSIGKELKRKYSDVGSLLDMMSTRPMNYDAVATRVIELSKISEDRTQRIASEPKNYFKDRDNIDRLISSVS